MVRVVGIDTTQMDIEPPLGDQAAVLSLILFGKDGSQYQLEFEGAAIAQLAELFQKLQMTFPEILTVQ